MGAAVEGAKRKRRGQLSLFDASGAPAAGGDVKKPRKRMRGVVLGRRPRPERLGFVGHDTRPDHDRHHPVHVSMRRVKRGPSFRTQRIYAAILVQLARVKRKGVRVVHYSVQHDHLHLIAEGKDRQDISNQMRTLFSCIALAVNQVAERRGRLFRDRHHRVELSSPSQVRNALVYVLFNDRKHHAQNGGNLSEELLASVDDRSSVGWLSEWNEDARPPPEALAVAREHSLTPGTRATPISQPRTWLATTGWYQRGGGRLRLYELPRF